MTRLRPGHADLPGVVKFGHDDVRNVLERASARETASRVAAGGLCKVFLRQFGIEVRSHVRSIGPLQARVPEELAVDRECRAARVVATRRGVADSDGRFANSRSEATELIKAARTDGDTLGGVFEVIGYGLPIGLGTYAQWDERLDGRLAAAMMSIQSIKGVEIGDAFANSARHGSAGARRDRLRRRARLAAADQSRRRAGGRHDQRRAADRARRRQAHLDADSIHCRRSTTPRASGPWATSSAATCASCPPRAWWAKRWSRWSWPTPCAASSAATASRLPSRASERYVESNG